jgi:PPP family 3-phenylpropionic acid transporter
VGLKARIRRAAGDREGNRIRLLFFVTFTAIAAWVPMFTLFLEREGLSGVRIGMLNSILPLSILLIQPLWGVTADRWGRQKCLNLTMLACSGVLLSFLWLHGFGALLAGVVLIGIFYNPISPLIDSVVLDHVESNPRLSYSVLRTWAAVGWAVSVPVVGRLIGGNYRLMFPIAAGLMLAGWAVSLGLPKARDVKGALDLHLRNLKPILLNRPLVLYLVLTFFQALAITSVWAYFGVYLDGLGASSSLIGLAFGIQAASEIPFYFIADRIIRRIGTERTLLLSLAGSTLRLFAYSVLRNPGAVLFVEPIHGISWALFWVSSVEHVNKLVKPEWRATGQSMLWAFNCGAGAILGNLWAGYQLDHFTAGRMYLVNGLMMGAVTAAGALVFRGAGGAARKGASPEPAPGGAAAP